LFKVTRYNEHTKTTCSQATAQSTRGTESQSLANISHNNSHTASVALHHVPRDAVKQDGPKNQQAGTQTQPKVCA